MLNIQSSVRVLPQPWRLPTQTLPALCPAEGLPLEESSRRHLPLLLALACLFAHAALDYLHHSFGGAEAQKYATDVLGSYIQFTSNLAVVRPQVLKPPDLLNARAKMNVQIETSPTRGTLKDSLVTVNENKRVLIRSQAIARIAPKLKELRKSLNFKQTDLATACAVSSVQISRWENGLDLPGPKALMVIARLASEDERSWWLREAGLEEEPQDVTSDERTIPVLRDAAAAGTPRVINEKEIAYRLSLPRQLIPMGGKLVGLKVEGDSMSPILETGYIALVDTTHRKPENLVGKMVAARDGDGVTIKWLRKQGKDMYLLVPQHTSPRHQVQIMQEDGDWSIVGEVVKWIGEPPQPRRKP